MEFPLYRVDISDDDSQPEEVNFIALVDKPAIESNFLAFTDNRMRFEITNEEERIVTGLAMIADLPIYRRDDTGEFYVYFDSAAIKKIALRFFRKGYNRNMNLSHDPEKLADGVYIFESWLVDRTKGKFPLPGFEEVKDGSWIISAKVDDPEIWKQVKAGKFNGFSVEGQFILNRIELPQESDAEFIAQLKKVLQEIDI